MLRDLRRTAKTLSYTNRPPTRESNPRPAKYEAGVLTTEPLLLDLDSGGSVSSSYGVMVVLLCLDLQNVAGPED